MLTSGSIKENISGVTIHYLCNQRVFPLLKNYSLLDKVFIFEKDEWRDALKKSKLDFFKKAVSFFKEIKKENYDIVFDLSLNSQYGFFLMMSGIKRRLGFNFKNRGRFLTDKIDITYGYNEKHVAKYHLKLLEFLNITPKDCKFELFVSDESVKKTKETLDRYGIVKGDLIVAVCPGAGDSWGGTAYFKRWPQENFLKLCGKFKDELNVKLVLFGSKPEEGVCSYISSELKDKVIDLCGKIDLQEFCAAISMCNLVITNDGGPFHIAQALSKSSIVLFGPVDEKVYGAYPLTDSCIVFAKHISCRPCYKSFKFNGCNNDKQCLREIGVDEVFIAAKSLLKL